MKSSSLVQSYFILNNLDICLKDTFVPPSILSKLHNIEFPSYVYQDMKTTKNTQAITFYLIDDSQSLNLTFLYLKEKLCHISCKYVDSIRLESEDIGIYYGKEGQVKERILKLCEKETEEVNTYLEGKLQDTWHNECDTKEVNKSFKLEKRMG